MNKDGFGLLSLLFFSHSYPARFNLYDANDILPGVKFTDRQIEVYKSQFAF